MTNSLNLPAIPVQGIGQSRKKILMVDDDSAVCQLCAMALETEGYQVYTAYNGEDALKVYEAEQPDMLVLDVAMPGLSGFEVVSVIRKIEPIDKHTVILLVTAYARTYFASLDFKAGADSFLTKPLLPDDLVYQVATLIGS